MKKINACLSLLLISVLLFTSVPSYASAKKASQTQQNAAANETSAAEVQPVNEETQNTDHNLQTVNFEKINPLYEYALNLEDAREHYASIPSAASKEDTEEAETVHTADEAANHIRQAMVKRQEEISFLYVSPDYCDYSEQSDLVNNAFDLTLEETGVPTEGDYLRFQWGYWNCSVDITSDDDNYYYLITYHMLYYTTEKQEQAVSDAAKQILSRLELDGKTTYEKAKAIYHYIIATVSYDYDTLHEDTYTLKYTAYAALINKTAICQGYCAALYRLLMEAGIPCRIILGAAGTEIHSWNIIQIGSCWYNADSTWDSSSYSEGDDFSWFLINEENFMDHTRDDEYRTEEFLAAYPIGNENYGPDSGDDVEPIDLDQPSITSLKNNFRRTITITWNRDPSVTGYQIQCFSISSPRSCKIVTVSKNTAFSKTLSRLITGKRYYIRIRSYKIVSGTTYCSAWSNVRNLKTSK